MIRGSSPAADGGALVLLRTRSLFASGRFGGVDLGSHRRRIRSRIVRILDMATRRYTMFCDALVRFLLLPVQMEEGARNYNGMLPTLLFLCLQAEHAIEMFFLKEREEVSAGECASDCDACRCASCAGANGRSACCC